VVPFLGAGASAAAVSSGHAMPSGRQFATLLADQATYPGAVSDPLSKIAQYTEEVAADRGYLLTTISSLFNTQIDASYRSSVTDFFGSIRPNYVPDLIVTTNYDLLVERFLEQKGLPYLAICHIMKGSKFAGRLLCYRSLSSQLGPDSIHTVKQVESLIAEFNQPPLPGATSPILEKPVLVYKMHGTAWMMAGSNQTFDSIVLTENDYVDFFAQDVLSRIPAPILESLRTRRFLFLGYALEDWNFRVLLKRLQSIQRRIANSPNRNWAFLLNADAVETTFWEHRGVNLYEEPLEQALKTLSADLSS
jgi:hypothetical protein